MSARIVISTPELSDEATVTASGSTTAGPVANLQKMRPTDLWESTTLTPYLEVDLGSVQSFNVVALLFSNASTSATWRIRAADTQANLTASPAHDVSGLKVRHSVSYVDPAIGEGSPVTNSQSPDPGSKRNHAFLWLPVSWSNRWVRIDISDASNPDGSLTVGRLYVANGFQPAYNYDYGAEDVFEDLVQRDETDGGSLIPGEMRNRPGLSLSMNLSSESERHSMRDINRRRGASKDVLIVTNPEETQNPADVVRYGLLQQRRAIVATRYNLNKQSYVLTEL